MLWIFFAWQANEFASIPRVVSSLRCLFRGIGFLLASISSYTGINVLPLGNPSSLLFVPQGIIMGAYGVLANILNFYLWYLVYINYGSGINSFDKTSKLVEIKRKGLFKDVEVKLNFDEIKSVKLDISEGFNPRRRIALVLKGKKKALPLSGAGELKPLLISGAFLLAC